MTTKGEEDDDEWGRRRRRRGKKTTTKKMTTKGEEDDDEGGRRRRRRGKKTTTKGKTDKLYYRLVNASVNVNYYMLPSLQTCPDVRCIECTLSEAIVVAHSCTVSAC